MNIGNTSQESRNFEERELKEGWQQGDTVAYLDNEAVFVPAKERQNRIICDRVLANCGSDAKVLELCCGSGQLALEFFKSHAGLQVVACDASEEMLQSTRKNCAPFEDRLTTVLFRLEKEDWRKKDLSFDAVVSSLAIHHLDAEEKRELFAYVFTILKPGGSFVVADLYEPTDQTNREILAKQWDEEVLLRSETLLGSPRGFEAFQALGWNYYRLKGPDPIDRPSGLADQLNWMTQAGFSDVDVHFALAGHAIFSGTRRS